MLQSSAVQDSIISIANLPVAESIKKNVSSRRCERDAARRDNLKK